MSTHTHSTGDTDMAANLASNPTRILPLLALSTITLVAPLTLSGCIVSSSSGSKISGAYVKPSSISRVHINSSTTSDVEEIMGEPTDRVQNDDGTETWTYEWTQTKASAGTVLFVFAGANKDTVSESLHVKFRDHIVIKKWRD